MVLFILIFILYYSWFGERIFSGTLEGVANFGTFPEAFYSMFICLTTSNFPDVMLPAYQINRWYAFFFISYLVIGLFLMMNLLLAIFYSNFKIRFKQSFENENEERSAYLYKKF